MSDQEKSYDTALAERTLEVGYLQRALGKKNRQNFKLRETIGELIKDNQGLLQAVDRLESDNARLHDEINRLNLELSTPPGVHIGPRFFSMKRDKETNTWHLDT